MATIKQRLCKRNGSGGYDVLHLETSADIVRMNDGTSAETAINGKAALTHKHAAADITSGTLSVARGGTGVTSIDALKTALGVTGATPSTTTISVGGTVSMANFDWICVHSTTEYYYLMTKYALGPTPWGSPASSEDIVAYSTSRVAGLCQAFAMTIGVYNNTAFAPMIIEDYTTYCGLASRTQVNGEFSYFNSDANRKATDINGTARSWWTCTPKGSSTVYYVGSSGAVGYGSVGLHPCGFRPLVALKR